MTHIEEHILELYVLGAGEVRDEQKSIEDHLRNCIRCRSLVEQMTRFYRDAETQFRRHPENAPVGNNSLIAARREVVHVIEGFEPVEIPARPTGLTRVRAFVGRHPFVSGAGSFALGVGVFFAASTLWTTATKDKNPSYTHYNPKENSIEVFNKRDERLWQKPTFRASDVEISEAATHIRQAVVGDIDGRGHNSVITSIPLWNDRENEWTPALRAFTSDGSTLFETDLNRVTRYRGRDYAADYYPHGIDLMDVPGQATKDIITVLTNHRSPCFLAHLDHRGKVLGEYWHFGHLMGPYEVPKSGAASTTYALCGVNDIYDSTFDSFPVIVILDASKIEGAYESTATPGYGLPPSEAELFYIRLARTDMAKALGITEGVKFLRFSTEPKLTFFVEGRDGDAIWTAFDYTFTKDMKIESIKSMSGMENQHARLRAQGKISSTFDASYMENLKQGIRYWNGREWRNEVVRVGNQASVAVTTK